MDSFSYYIVTVIVIIPLMWLLFHSEKQSYFLVMGISTDPSSSVLKKSMLPPGPPKLPLIGNSHQFPKVRPWEVFAKWAKEYGDIIHLSAARRNIVILSSPEHVNRLLNQRSAIYSDRPIVPFAGELVGFGQGLTMSQRGEWHTGVRKMMASQLGAGPVRQFYGMQETETKRLLVHLVQRPHDFRDHLRHFAGSLVLRIAYGYKTLDQDDPMIKVAERALQAISTAGTPGKWMVDIIPALKYIPSWFPGAGFKQQAKIWNRYLHDFYNNGFDWVESQMANGNAPPSYAAGRLSMTDPDDSLTRHMILHSSAAMYGGGADTTTSAMTTFFLQMILNPDIQARAAAEVDNVVEASRLPDASDKANLPYINALVRECMRILPVAPLGVPHRLNQEDRYDGFILPKDTIVYANIWSILHDERSYPEPEVFLPERHLNLNELPRDTARERDPFTYAFGYGRRRCPGQYLAEMTLFVAMAGVLSLFEIRPGKSDPRSVGSTTGAFTHPEQFDCELVLRSKERAALLG